MGENLANVANENPDVIRTAENPFSETGGIAVLRGNLAPDGSVVKRSAVAPEMLVHEGPARVFDCEEDAQLAINAGKINAGDVIVIRYEGPKGGPGMDCWMSDPAVRSNLGDAILGNRDHWYVQGHIGSAWDGAQYVRTRDVEKCKVAFDDILSRFHTDHMSVWVPQTSGDRKSVV